MALAPLAHVLWTRVMRYDADDPDWPDRDRFVLSAGHASILLYSMLHLTGYGLELDDLEAFRQWGSPHAGPPRGAPHRRASRSPPARSARASPTRVGMAHRRALAAGPLRRRRRRPPHLRASLGDGDLEEGISHEAASLAGHLGLGRLVYVYDDNHISIDGPTELALSATTPPSASRPTAGTSSDARRGRQRPRRPRGRRCAGPWPSRTGRRCSSCAATSATRRPSTPTTATAHGNAARRRRDPRDQGDPGPPATRPFCVPDDVARRCTARPARAGRAEREAWEKRLDACDRRPRRAATPASAGRGLAGLGRRRCPTWEPGEKVATRKAQRRVPRARSPTSCPASSAAAPTSPATPARELKGHGVQSTATTRRAARSTSASASTAWAASMNGMALHGGVLPVGGTFLVFPDYMRGRRPARRASARPRSSSRSPTTRSASARTARPTSRSSTSPRCGRSPASASSARPTPTRPRRRGASPSTTTGPTALILSRQDLPVLEGTARPTASPGAPTCCGPSTADARPRPRRHRQRGVASCVEAAELLAAEGIARPGRVDAVLGAVRRAGRRRTRTTSCPPDVPTLAVEAGVVVRLGPLGRRLAWHRPLRRLARRATWCWSELGFTAENVAERARELLDDLPGPPPTEEDPP